MTREELINVYIETMRAEGKSEGTINEYLKHINEYFEYLDKKNIDFMKVKQVDVKLFRNQNPNLSSSTKNLKVSSIKSFYTFLIDDIEITDYNPCSNIKSLDVENDRVEKVPLTKIQIHWLINSCKNVRDRAIISMLVNTGLRIHELINVTFEDYKYAKSHEGELHVIGKGNKFRIVYIPEITMKYIDEYLNKRKESEYNNLFISNGCKPMSRNCISDMLKVTAKRSGRFSDDEIKKIHNHLLRHVYTTEAIELNIPLEVVSKTLGHSSTNTTYKIYMHMNKNRIKENMKNFSI